MIQSFKKTSFGFLITLGCASGSVWAQSSITLFGAIDTSLTYINHARGAQNMWSLGNASNGDLTGTGWGVRGAESLADGLRVVYQFENGFSPTNGRRGEGGRLFGRNAYVGLDDDRLGTLTLGRQYDPLTEVVSAITADASFGSAFATPGDVDNDDASFWVDNAIKFVSRDLYGVRFSAMYALGGIAGAAGAGQSYAAAVSWHKAGWRLAGGYFHTSNSAGGIRREGWASTADGSFDGPVNVGYATAHSIAIARVAAQYSIRRVTAGASYSHTQYQRDGASSFTDDERYDTMQGFLTYTASQALLLGGGYAYTKAAGYASAHYHQVSLGADYTLSPLTDVYVLAAWQRASGTVGEGVPARASIGSYGYAGTRVQAIAVVGFRHRF
jgi:predicted porin